MNRPLLIALFVLACRPGEGRDPGEGPASGLPSSGLPAGGTSPQTGTPPSTRIGLVEGGRIQCENPEERDTLGPFYRADLGPQWAAQVPATMGPGEQPLASAGFVIEDFTGDGLLDHFVAHFDGNMLFVGQEDGSLVDESWRIPDRGPESQGWNATGVDADGDGDLDLYVGGEGSRDQLWENDGAGNFTDVTDAAGLVDINCATRGASWGDMDGDGDLDLAVARHRKPGGDAEGCPDAVPPAHWSTPAGDSNSLYENLGGLVFRDVTERLPFHANYGHTFMLAWQDFDVDGDADLYFVNDFGAKAAATNILVNDGTGHFTELSEDVGIFMRPSGMGLGVGDINEDGVPDYAITEIKRIHLLVSGPGVWINSATALGIRVDPDTPHQASWGVEIVDIDNDSDLDLMNVWGPTEGHVDPESELFEQPDSLWIQDDQGMFSDEAAAWGVDDIEIGRALVVADLNGDGWLDLVRSAYRQGPVRVDYQRCGSGSWLEVHLQGEKHGIGAEVIVRFEDRELRRWHTPTSTSMASNGPLDQVHFGLGDVEQVDELEVRWSDGSVSFYRHVDARQHVTVIQHPE